MNKCNALRTLGFVAAVLATSSAWSIPVSSVGSVDKLIGATQLKSGGLATEEAWVESVLGTNVTFTGKVDQSRSWERVTVATKGKGVGYQADVYAQYLEAPADYFLVKAGKLTGKGNSHFLFRNTGGLAYAVVDLSALGFSFKQLEVTKVSHLSLLNVVAQVPDPSALGLLGLGLVGLGLIRRRRS